MKRKILAFATLLILTACGKLDTIPYTPAQTPQSWLQMQPYVHIDLIVWMLYIAFAVAPRAQDLA
jgi:midasin (ATPase involved in ribosome maturation)